MPVLLSAYDTTLGRRYHTDSTELAIVKATVSNYLAKNDDDYQVIDNTDDMPIDIPAFMHPLWVNKGGVEGLYVDARHYVTYNRQSGEKKVAAVADYNLLRARAGLEYLWRTESPSIFRSNPFPASVYAHWLAESIGRNKGLEPQDQYRLTVFSAWFFYSLFSTEDMPDERDYLRCCQNISKATKISVDQVMAVLDGQSYVKSILDYCERLEEVVGSVRLKGFSSILLYPMLTSTWFGANSNEIVSVAIEHVPSFLAICLAACTERSYNRSQLSKMAERVPAKSSADDFVKQMTAMLRS